MEIDKEDNSLINRFLEGDQEGFNMLVRKYQNRVFNTIYSLIGSNSGVDDIAQDVFIKVYRNLSFFNRKAEFSTWLYRIVVNTTYNHLKKEKKYTSLDYALDKDNTNSRESKGLVNQETQELVRNAIDKLPFKYRTVVVLKDIEGFSYGDIAKTLGCSIGTVESRIFRARNILKEILTPLKKEL